MTLQFDNDDLNLLGFVDSDMARDIDELKNNTGYVFKLGSAAITYVSRLQKIVTLSTTEAEYVEVVEATKEMVWLKSLLNELRHPQINYKLFSDSQSVIHLAKNSVYHARTKYIDIRYHYIRDMHEGR